MHELPRQKLCELIATYGRSVCDDPRRCEGLLRDYCGVYKREIHVLVSALKERVAADLLGSHSGVPREVVIARLTKRLQDDLGLAEDAARWAVESWALALGVIASAGREAKSRDRQESFPAPKRERPPRRPVQDALVLTPREQEVVCLFTQGYGDEQIAQKLCIQRQGVGAHLATAQRKVGVFSRPDLLTWAVTQGLQPPRPEPPPAAAETKRAPVKQGKAAAEQPHVHRPTDPVPPPPLRDSQPANPGGRRGSNWVQWVVGLALFLLGLLSVNDWKLPFARPVAHTAPSVSQPAPPASTSRRECYDFATREYGACGRGHSDSGTPAERTPSVTTSKSRSNR